MLVARSRGVHRVAGRRTLELAPLDFRCINNWWQGAVSVHALSTFQGIACANLLMLLPLHELDFHFNFCFDCDEESFNDQCCTFLFSVRDNGRIAIRANR